MRKKPADFYRLRFAVADYCAETISDAKSKKQGDELTLKMVKNRISLLASPRAENPSSLRCWGLPQKQIMWKNMPGKKRTRKNLDLICANDVSLARKDLTATATCTAPFLAGWR